jgi:hypothetical protein
MGAFERFFKLHSQSIDVSMILVLLFHPKDIVLLLQDMFENTYPSIFLRHGNIRSQCNCFHDGIPGVSF